MATNPIEACVICHMPEGDASLPHQRRSAVLDVPGRRPLHAARSTPTPSPPDGNYPSAVWVDLDSACGQVPWRRHERTSTTTGSITAGSKLRHGGRTAGVKLHVGERVEIVGAGRPTTTTSASPSCERPRHLHRLRAPATFDARNGNGHQDGHQRGRHAEPGQEQRGSTSPRRQLAVQGARGSSNDEPYVTFGYRRRRPTPCRSTSTPRSPPAAATRGLRRLRLELGRRDRRTRTAHATPSHTYATARRHAGDHPDGRRVRRQRRFDQQERPGVRRDARRRRRHGLRQHRQPEHLGGQRDRQLDRRQRRQAGDGQLGRRRRDVERHRHPPRRTRSVVTHTYLTRRPASARAVTIKQTAYDSHRPGQRPHLPAAPAAPLFTISGNAAG